MKQQESKPITEEILAKLRENRKGETPRYTSGREIQLGDTMYFGWVIKEGEPTEVVEPSYESPMGRTSPMKELKMELISFHSEEIGVLYEEVENSRYASSVIPELKLIQA